MNMYKILAARELPTWDEQALENVQRKMKEITGKNVGRVIVAPPGYFTLDRDSPESRVAAFFTVPVGLQKDRGEEGVLVVSSRVFEPPKVDSLIWGVRSREELERFWDAFPFVRDTHSLIVFMRHPHLGIAVSHSSSGHAHTLLALRYVHQTLFPEAAWPPEDYPHLPRGRIHVHVTQPPTITFSTEWTRQIDPDYGTYLARIKVAVCALQKLGLPRDSRVEFDGKNQKRVRTTARTLLADRSAKS